MVLSSLFSFFDRKKPADASPDAEGEEARRSEDPGTMPALAMEPADPPPASVRAASPSTSAAPPRIVGDALSIYGVGPGPAVEKTENYTPESPLLSPAPMKAPDADGLPTQTPAAKEAQEQTPAAPSETNEASAAPAPSGKPLSPPPPVAEAIPFGDLETEESFAAEHPESAPKRRRAKRAPKAKTASSEAPLQRAEASDSEKGASKKARKTRGPKAAKKTDAAPSDAPKRRRGRRRKPAPLDDALKAEALALFQKGGTVEAAAKTLQLPRSVVSGWMEEYLAGTLLSKKSTLPQDAPQQDALF